MHNDFHSEEISKVTSEGSFSRNIALDLRHKVWVKQVKTDLFQKYVPGLIIVKEARCRVIAKKFAAVTTSATILIVKVRARYWWA